MGTIEKVQEGMHVVDAGGGRVGKVSAVSIGDPEAATVAGQEFPVVESPVIEELRSALGGVDLPDEQAQHLLRTGFVRVRRTLRKDFLATREDLDRVDGGTVFLAVDVR